MLMNGMFKKFFVLVGLAFPIVAMGMDIKFVDEQLENKTENKTGNKRMDFVCGDKKISVIVNKKDFPLLQTTYNKDKEEQQKKLTEQIAQAKKEGKEEGEREGKQEYEKHVSFLKKEYEEGLKKQENETTQRIKKAVEENEEQAKGVRKLQEKNFAQEKSAAIWKERGYGLLALVATAAIIDVSENGSICKWLFRQVKCGCQQIGKAYRKWQADRQAKAATLKCAIKCARENKKTETIKPGFGGTDVR
jgi:hypothetical protein